MKAARGVVCNWIGVLLLAFCARGHASQGYVVSGTVVDYVTGQPLPGIALTLTSDKESASSQSTLSSKNGQFAFPSVPAGKYILSGSGPGYRAQGLNQHGSFFTGVAVAPNLDASNVLFRMQRDASIQGHVIDDQNEAVRNATVQLFMVDDSAGVRRVATETNAGTNDQGVYHFPHLAPGTYYVAVSARPWYAQYQPHGPHSQPRDVESAAHAQEEVAQFDVAYALTFYPDAVDSSQANAITLQSGDRTTADVAMRAVPAVHLRIRSDGAPQSGPAPGLKQRVFDSLLIPVFGATIFGFSQGAYEVGGLAPGHYVVELERAAAGNEPGGRGWFRDVDVYGDMEISAADSPAMATVTGLVTYEGGLSPTGSAYVTLRNRDSGEEWTSEVSSKGLFGLQNNELHPGTYEVALYNAAKFFITRIVAQNAKVQGSEVTLTPGSSAKLVFTATHVSATITGTVMHDDKPFAGALVLLVPEDAVHHTELYRRDQSDSDGTFTLPQVPPGRYTAVAIQNGWTMEWGNAEVLEPYLAKGEKITIGDKSATVKLQAQ
jgi:hypothetical protein